jgi:hypothetical protein
LAKRLGSLVAVLADPAKHDFGLRPYFSLFNHSATPPKSSWLPLRIFEAIDKCEIEFGATGNGTAEKSN